MCKLPAYFLDQKFLAEEVCKPLLRKSPGMGPLFLELQLKNTDLGSRDRIERIERKRATERSCKADFSRAWGLFFFFFFFNMFGAFSLCVSRAINYGDGNA